MEAHLTLSVSGRPMKRMMFASSSGEAAAEVDPSSSAPVEAAVEAEAGIAAWGKRKTGMVEP